MSSTFLTVLDHLARVTSGAPLAEAARRRVHDTLAAFGMSDDGSVPSYFFDAIRRLASGPTMPWVVLPAQESGHTEVLSQLAEQLPGAVFERTPAQSVFHVKAAGRALLIARTQGDPHAERYAVVDLDASSRPRQPPRRKGPTVLGTLAPSDDQLRRWAFDPDLLMHTQDEEDALAGASVRLLVELARDPAAAAKRDRLRGAILTEGLGRILLEGPRVRALMDETAAALLASGDDQLVADGATVAAVGAYLDELGPVDEVAAKRIARLLLVGGANVDIDARPVDGWWELAIADRPPYDRLYVQASTGALVYRRGGALQAADLLAVGAPAARDAALGRTLAGSPRS